MDRLSVLTSLQSHKEIAIEWVTGYWVKTSCFEEVRDLVNGLSD